MMESLIFFLKKILGIKLIPSDSEFRESEGQSEKGNNEMW
jgi:hypothetical protein